MRRYTGLSGYVAALAALVMLAGSIAGLVSRGAQAQTQGRAETAASALGEVDVALVLAVDISYSMDLDELSLQRAGYVQALRSPEVHKAIANGATGRIAVTYFEWAGHNIQHHLVPWMVIDNAESAMAVASLLEQQPIRRGQRTSVSAAIDFGVRQIEEGPFRALRKVIDVSGDGPNNSGRPVTVARDEAVAKGISINGLPITVKRPGYLDIADLDAYYEDCVIGGRSAFAITITSREQFATSIRSKLIMEISADEPPYGPLVKPASVTLPRVSCTIGEDMWRQRMGN